MSTPRVLTAADIRDRLAKHAEPATPAAPKVGKVRGRLREAVALADAFTVTALPAATDAERTAFVLKDCERIKTADGDRWRLRNDVRSETIRHIGTAEKLRARAKSAHRALPEDLALDLVRRYLDGTGPPLREQSPEQLAVLLRVIGWLSGITDVELPSADDVRAALDIGNLLQPLRSVADSQFVGRQADLAVLEKFVTGPPSMAPLLVHGVGGVGKSTLVARFLLTRVVDRPGIAFVYLSFDHADLRPDRPLSLLAEAARQLALQAPERADDLRACAAAALDVQRLEIRRRGESISKSTGSAEAGSRVDRDERNLIRRFGAVAPPNQLWVLDTFEQAQRRGDVATERLWNFFDALQFAVADGVRVVIAGRSPITDHELAVDLPLAGLDPELAREFLRRQLADLDISAGVISSLVDVVRANPLSLRLAAAYLRSQGPAALQTAAGRRRFFEGLQAEQIQGVLYRRTLDHIADPDVRALANPGLALRRVTPDLIRFVLARPCGLGTIDDARARELFAKLAAERLLVEQPEPGVAVLVHRADVRREMLTLLQAADADNFAAINRAAVKYYADQPEPSARVEELYHRLMLGQTSRTLDEHWDDAVEQLLLPAIDELPAASRVYLAERLTLSVQGDDLQAADDIGWARQAERQARAFIDDGQPGRALELLRSRQLTDPPTSLIVLEAEALVADGDRGGAIGVIVAAMGKALESGQTQDVAELALLGARLAQDTGDLDGAQALYSQASGVAGSLGDIVSQLAGEVGQLRVYRIKGDTASAGYQKLREVVADEAQSLDPKQRAQNPSLVRELAAEVGSLSPELLIDAVRLNGLDVVGEGAELLDSEGFGEHVKLIQDNVLSTSPGDDPMPEPALTSAEQASAVADYLGSESSDSAVHTAVTEVYQQEVDRASFTYKK